MLNKVALVIWLVGVSSATAFGQDLSVISPLPAAPEPVAIVTEAPEPVTLVSEPSAVIPASETLVIASEFQVQPAPADAWTQQRIQATMEAQAAYQEYREVLDKQVFTYAPNDYRNFTVVPEPSSIAALATGIISMAGYVAKRRRTSVR